MWTSYDPHKVFKHKHNVSVDVYFLSASMPTFLFKFGNPIQESRETMSSWYTAAKNNIPCELLSITPGNGHENVLKKGHRSGKLLFEMY